VVLQGAMMALRAVLWRVVEYNKGPVAAFTVIVTVLLGFLDLYFRVVPKGEWAVMWGTYGTICLSYRSNEGIQSVERGVTLEGHRTAAQLCWWDDCSEIANRLDPATRSSIGYDTLIPMTITNIVSLIDSEIANLQKARAILAGTSLSSPATKRPVGKAAKVKRTMTAEGRAKIAAAQRKRWAAQKMAAK
jgi:hypothetical protein